MIENLQKKLIRLVLLVLSCSVVIAAKEEIKKLKVAVADSVLAENDRLKSQIEHLMKEKKDQEKFIVELTGKLQAKSENN